MIKIRYIGPFDEVTITATGQNVQRNHQVEIEDDDLARNLLEQKNNWERVSTTKKKGDS